MKETRLLMGMPITVEVVGGERATQAIDDVFNYFHRIDEQFSTYKESSEISRINRDELTEAEWSEDIRLVFALCEQTNRETNGYFDIRARNGLLDPSGLVKGWAIRRAAELLDKQGWKNFFVDAGGDIQARGKNERNEPWRVGIQNPFNTREIIKIIYPGVHGVATSGTYLRGQHIYNPFDRSKTIEDIVSLTVIGPDVYEADRFATAAFAMGKEGIRFIESLNGFDGYMVDVYGMATMTSGFSFYTRPPEYV